MATYELKNKKNPPISEIGVIKWLHENLFSSLFNSILTLFALYLLYLIIPPLADWLYFGAEFGNVANDQCTREAACWTYIGKKLNLYIYGFYPEEHYWRIHLTFALVAVFSFIPRLFKNNPHRFKLIAFLFISYPILAFYLLYGGIGLEVVETHKWGGLTLTIIIAAVGIVASFPIGILMALGRQSKMKVIRFFSVLYIEFIRGVPLITILFMASVVLPLFFSEGIDVDKLLRALIGITLFQAAYIAEVIRGGLQAIPRGQYEAADAMGLSFFQKTSLIILPQALKISIPNIVGSFISLFKDTTLVLIIGLFDMLAIVGLSTSDVNWLGRETEGYVFVAFVLWIILYSMSKYSKNIEKRYNTELDKEKL